MNSFIYKISFLVSIITFVICTFTGITLITGLLRSAIVFLGVLFAFFIVAQLLNFGLMLTQQKPKQEEDET